MFHLDDMANVCVYGVTTAADISANCWKHSPNIFWSSVLQFYINTSNYCIVV